MPRPIRNHPSPAGPAPARNDSTPATPSPATGGTTPAGRTGWSSNVTGPAPAGGDAFSTPGRTGGAAGQVKLGTDLFLSSSGHFVGRAGQDQPVSPAELGEVMNRAAQKVDAGVNVFQDPKVTLAQKTQALAALGEAFELGKDPAKFNGDKNQALQTRADAAPLVLDLVKSLDPNKPAEKKLQDQAVAQYLKMLDTEPHGQLRTFMLYDLDRARPNLPAGVKPTVEKLMREVAPLTPPYDEWFKNGNTKLKLDYYVGDTFWDEETKAYQDAGFKRTDNPDGTATLSKHMEAERKLNDGTTQKYVTDVEIVMHNGPSGMFDHVNDPSVAGIIYSGHADYGREVPSHLDGAPAMSGAKVFFAQQCGGKGIQNALGEQYPDMQFVGSKNSSYGYQDRAMMLNTLDGISKRLPWSQIATQNASSNSDNYYFPSDTLISRRAQDHDHDGRVDAWDRVLDVNPFHPQADIQQQLTPKDPGKPADELDGRAVTGSMLRFWRLAGYNTWAEGLKDQGMVANGYYDGKKNDPMFKLTTVKGEDGKDVVSLQVNKFYAHASEETLGAAMHYELGRDWARKGGLNDEQAKAAGLLMAAEALNVDTSDNDDAAWKALLVKEGLPTNVSLSDAQSANAQNEEYSAGAPDTLKTFLEALHRQHVNL